jgi:hypothetical protein
VESVDGGLESDTLVECGAVSTWTAVAGGHDEKIFGGTSDTNKWHGRAFQPRDRFQQMSLLSIIEVKDHTDIADMKARRSFLMDVLKCPREIVRFFHRRSQCGTV